MNDHPPNPTDPAKQPMSPPANLADPILPPPSGHPWRDRFLLVVVIGLVAAGIYFLVNPSPSTETKGHDGKHFDPANRLMPVVAVPATVGKINVYLQGLGTVTPLQTVTIRSRVDGPLVQVMFQEGQMVKTGDLLAVIDEKPYQVLLEQAEGQLAKDQASLVSAQVDEKRYRTLVAQDSIAHQQLDTQAALVRQYQGAVQVDQAQVDTAKLQLSYAHILSPLEGRIGLRQVDQGNMIHASDANGLVVIAQLQPISVLFSLPEDSLPVVLRRMHEGATLPVALYDREQKTLLATGTLLTVDNQIDTTTGMIRLRAQFANQDQMLFPNQFVNARMQVETREKAILIPNSAIQQGVQGTFVYLVNPQDRTVSVRIVKVGPAEGGKVAIDSGLVANESVVVDGADKLRDGSKVEWSGPPGADTPAKEADNPHHPHNGNWKKEHPDKGPPPSDSKQP